MNVILFFVLTEKRPIAGYIPRGKYDYKFSQTKAPFETVISHCRDSGGDILQLNTKEKLIAITNFLSGKIQRILITINYYYFFDSSEVCLRV